MTTFAVSQSDARYVQKVQSNIPNGNRYFKGHSNLTMTAKYD